MAKRRVYDIAKEKGLTNQELLERLRAAGLDVKSSVSSVEEADVDRLVSGRVWRAKGHRNAGETGEVENVQRLGELRNLGREQRSLGRRGNRRCPGRHAHEQWCQ